MLNAYFTVGAIAAIAEDCHDQKIQGCPCLSDNARLEDEEGNVVFEACRADYNFATRYIDEFVVSQIDQTDFRGKIDVHNIGFGKQVGELNHQRLASPAQPIDAPPLTRSPSRLLVCSICWVSNGPTELGTNNVYTPANMKISIPVN